MTVALNGVEQLCDTAGAVFFVSMMGAANSQDFGESKTLL